MTALVCADPNGTPFFVDVETNNQWFILGEYKPARPLVRCSATNQTGIANLELGSKHEDGRIFCWIYRTYFQDEADLEVDDVI